jgi:hypothetical protein
LPVVATTYPKDPVILSAGVTITTPFDVKLATVISPLAFVVA